MLKKIIFTAVISLLSQLNAQSCTWEIKWELDCIRNVNIGFKCDPSGIKLCQTNYGSVTYYGCWNAPSTSYTFGSPPFCHQNTGWVGSPPGCLTRYSLLLCINGVPYEHGDIICCNDPPGGIYPFYPYCSSCGCAMVRIDEAAEKIYVTDPRPFGNYCPPQGN